MLLIFYSCSLFTWQYILLQYILFYFKFANTVSCKIEIISVCIILLMLTRVAFICSRESGRCLCDHKRFLSFSLLEPYLAHSSATLANPALRYVSHSTFFYPLHLPDPPLSCCSLWFLSLLNALLRANGFKTFFKCLPVSLQSCCLDLEGFFGKMVQAVPRLFVTVVNCQMNEKHNCIPCTSKSSISLAINGIRASVLLSDSISMPQWVFLP